MSTSSKDAMDAAFDSQTGSAPANTQLDLDSQTGSAPANTQLDLDSQTGSACQDTAYLDPFEPEAAPAPSSFKTYSGYEKLNVIGEPEGTAQVVGSMAHNVSDALAARDARGKRVTLKGIQDRIESCVFINAAEAAGLGPRHPLARLTLALVTLDNGWTVVGKSACADPLNFDPEKGKRFAIDDAIEQLWGPMAFELRERLHIARELGLGEAVRQTEPDMTPLTDEFKRKFGL